MAKVKSPYTAVLGGRLEIDLVPLAPEVIEEHARLLADGYALKTPVTVAILKDGRIKVPFAYRRRIAEGLRGRDVTTWTVTVYAGWMFGKGPKL